MKNKTISQWKREVEQSVNWYKGIVNNKYRLDDVIFIKERIDNFLTAKKKSLQMLNDIEDMINNVEVDVTIINLIDYRTKLIKKIIGE